MSTRTITGQTAIFTPPADCRNSWTYEGSYYNAISNGYLMQNVLSQSLASTCFPKSFTAAGRASSISLVYSPGACPSGYVTPGAFTNDGTTTATCCPSGFKFYSVYSSVNFASASSVQFQGCVSTFLGMTTVEARANNTDLDPSYVVTGPVTMWAQPISIVYDQQDLSLFITASTSISSSSSSASTSQQSSQTNSGTSSSPTSTSVSGLSTGAKAGIGVGAAAGVLFILGLILFFVMRHRKNKLSSTIDSKEPYSQQHQMAQQSPQWERAELDPDQVHRSEMSGNGVPYRDTKIPQHATELE